MFWYKNWCLYIFSIALYAHENLSTKSLTKHFVYDIGPQRLFFWTTLFPEDACISKNVKSLFFFFSRASYRKQDEVMNMMVKCLQDDKQFMLESCKSCRIKRMLFYVCCNNIWTLDITLSPESDYNQNSTESKLAQSKLKTKSIRA